jgi:hypothetical protein
MIMVNIVDLIREPATISAGTTNDIVALRFVNNNYILTLSSMHKLLCAIPNELVSSRGFSPRQRRSKIAVAADVVGSQLLEEWGHARSTSPRRNSPRPTRTRTPD